MAFHNQQDDGSRQFTRRAIFIGGLQLFGIGVLSSRLAWLQLFEGSKYKTLSDQNRISIRLIAPLRGQIIDRFGVPLAVNSQNYRVLVVPEQTKDLEETLKALQKVIPVDDRDVKRVLKEAKRNQKFFPLKVREDLNWEEVVKVEVSTPDLPGVMVDKGEMRNYPFGGATAHVIGYVRAVGEDDLSDDNPMLRLPGFKIGKTGIEKMHDLDLRGKAGATEVEVNVMGREVRELGRKPAVSGERVVLSIDGEMQRFVQEILAQHQSASAVVMDAHTGAVYAMASHPSFDPNAFVRGVTQDMWQMMMADPGRPQTNKTLEGQYPPGSTFKMITALAGLEAGVINEHTSVFCPGHYSFGDAKFHCWKKGGHGTVDVRLAIQKSCDTFFYKISTEIGIERIAKMAHRFGLGDLLDFEIDVEKKGLIPDGAWKLKKFGVKWQPGETIVCSIGQGYTLTTPLQLAVMTARLVNGGYAVKPWITQQIGDKILHRPGEFPKIGIDEKLLNPILDGMRLVVNEAGGTAYASRIKEFGFEMGGKTGTSQVQRITKEQRRLGVKNEDLPWEQRHHALFVGYAPLHAPKYVCAVVVEHGVGGGSAAAPLAKEILQLTQQRDPASARVDNNVVPRNAVNLNTSGDVYGPKQPFMQLKMER